MHIRKSYLVFLVSGLISGCTSKTIPPFLEEFNQVGFYKENNKFGLDREGKKITQPIFDSIPLLFPGASVTNFYQNGKQGMLSLNGTILLEAKYDEVKFGNLMNKGEQLFLVKKNNKYSVIDVNEENRLSAEYDYIDYTSMTDIPVLLVKLNNKYGVIDLNDNVIEKIVYDNAKIKIGMIEKGDNILRDFIRLGNQKDTVFIMPGKKGIQKASLINMKNILVKLDGDVNEILYDSLPRPFPAIEMK